MNRHVLQLIVLLNIVVGLVPPCYAQDSVVEADAPKDEAATKKAVTEHWLGVADKLAKDYVFSPASATDRPFTLHDKAVFRHTQTVRGDDIGSVYLWKESSGSSKRGEVSFIWRRTLSGFGDGTHETHLSGSAVRPGLETTTRPRGRPKKET